MAESLGLDASDHCLDMMPLHHVHGLMALLSSLVAGSRVSVTPGFDAARVLDWLQELAPTWYTAAPPIHRAIAAQLRQQPRALRGARLRFVRSSSAALPRDVALELEDILGVPVLEAYGMTEAAHQIASNPLPPGQRKAGSVGLPTGTDVMIAGADGAPLPRGAVGQIAIRGGGVTAGYVDGAEDEVAVFRDGWFLTGDLGWQDAEGYLFVTGRVKEMVNRGGEKVAPAEVEEALCEHPAVMEAAAFPVPHHTLGETVGAAVVLRPDDASEPGPQDLRVFVAARLADFKVPSHVWIVDEIPRTSTGKPRRAVLAARLGAERRPDSSGLDAARPNDAPRSRAEDVVAAVWGEVLECDGIGRSANLFDLGGDSIHAGMIASRLAVALGVRVSISEVLTASTVVLLAQLIEDRLPDLGAVTGPLVVRADRAPGTRCPLSLAQEPVWMLQQVEPGLVAYNVPRAIRLRGDLDVAAMRGALDALVVRHEALRTTFHANGAEPVQVIEAARRLPLPVVDLGDLEEAPRALQLPALMAAEARRPFDLTVDPMLRPLLLRLAADDHVLLMTIHHLACDGWSAGVLTRDLSALYGAVLEGRPAGLPELSIQPADFDRWQRERLHGGLLEAQLPYWRAKLVGAPPALDLSIARARPPVQSFRGARRAVTVPRRLVDALRGLGQGEEATLFMTLLAAFKVLLSRYSGQEDVVVGTATAGRVLVETEPLIGLFADTLALRTDLSGDPTFRELLGRVRETCLGAYARQSVPFGKLLEALRPPRDPARSPLYQTMLVLQNAPQRVPAMPGLSVSAQPVNVGAAKLDLVLDLQEGDDGLHGTIEYCTDLFDPAAITRLAGHLEVLLTGIVADPDSRISALPLLTEGEWTQVAVEWNGTAPAAASGPCLHELFESQVDLTPHAVALLEAGSPTTYAELDRRANQIAHALSRGGVGAESRVGVLLDRGVEAVVAMLATLKAGGAYVPMDPTYPPERLALMLSDARPDVVVTRRCWRPLLSADRPPVLCLDGDAARIGQEPSSRLQTVVSDELPAYVIYTSGSTGRPKGVVGQHRGMTSLLRHLGEAYPFEPGEVLCQKTALSFVDSVWEVFWPLLRGVPSEILPEGDVREPVRLVERLAAARVTRIVLVPSLLSILLDEVEDLAGRLPRLMLWMVGGEELSRDLAARFVAAMPGRCLVNQYGASEASAVSALWEVASPLPEGRVPIGRPTRGTRTYVLDRGGQLVPVGVEGELHVGGVGLARGYWAQPGLTAERFVPDRVSGVPGARLYRMGDRARYRADGAIEYLGRQDQQVKVRGYRIELGEIDAALRRHAGVREAATVVRAGAAGGARLVAHVAWDGPRGSVAELRAGLQRALPAYMLPAAIVEVDALPLTPSGKVDRRALPEPATVIEQSGEFVPPDTAVERRIAGIWEELLEVRPVGRTDNFFELGGHSIVAVRLISRLREVFGISLRLRTVFDGPTVGELAAHVPGGQAPSGGESRA